jgi:hypothetical protein
VIRNGNDLKVRRRNTREHVGDGGGAITVRRMDMQIREAMQFHA